MATLPSGTNYSGWHYDADNARLDYYYRGTRTGHITATTLTNAVGITATTGNIIATAGDVRVTAANVRLGAVETFGTTEPTSAIVFKSGTAVAAAITTSGGLQATDTVVTKIIAAGTVSNVET